MAGGEVSRFWRSVLASGKADGLHARRLAGSSRTDCSVFLVRDAAAMGVRWETLARSNLVTGVAEARRLIAGS
jgi:hypothetical protein